MATFLLEIRTEEIPAAALPGARRQLEDLFSVQLAEAGFADLNFYDGYTANHLEPNSSTMVIRAQKPV